MKYTFTIIKIRLIIIIRGIEILNNVHVLTKPLSCVTSSIIGIIHQTHFKHTQIFKKKSSFLYRLMQMLLSPPYTTPRFVPWVPCGEEMRCHI